MADSLRPARDGSFVGTTSPLIVTASPPAHPQPSYETSRVTGCSEA